MVLYEETQLLIPKQSFLILCGVFLATIAFMIIMTLTGNGSDWRFIEATTAAFVVAILMFLLMKIKVIIDEENITVHYIKKYVFPVKNVIDIKTGDIDVIRNYSGWGLKNVKFKNFIAHGYEQGISFKLMGRMVLTLSTADPEAIRNVVPINKED